MPLQSTTALNLHLPSLIWTAKLAKAPPARDLITFVPEFGLVFIPIVQLFPVLAGEMIRKRGAHGGSRVREILGSLLKSPHRSVVETVSGQLS